MKLQIILAISRPFLTIGGGYLVQQGYTNQDGATQAVGAVMTLIGLGWSITHKVKNESVAPGQAQGILGGAVGGSSQETGDRSQNFTGGTSPNVLPLILFGVLSSMFCCSAFAADSGTGVPPVGIHDQTGGTPVPLAAVPANAINPSWLTALANAALEYCTTNHNFVPTSGPGGTVVNLRNAKVSAVIAESLTIWDTGGSNATWKLDAAHATCIGDGKTHEGLGIDLRFIGQLPPSWKLHLPVLGKLGTFHTLAGIAPDLDQAIKGRFDERSTVCWFGFGLGGE